MSDVTYTVLTLECEAVDADGIAEVIRETFELEPVELSRPARDIRWFECYFTDETEALLAQQVLQGLVRLRTSSIRACEARDWQSFWKQHFHPVRIGRRLHIVPEWEADTPDQPDDIRILIQPGLSFGTGDHFTTRFCLESLEELMDRDGPLPMLDAGTGSGIIAITAALMGCPKPYAFDNDELALTQARENAVLNGVGDEVQYDVLDLTTQSIPGTYPLVCANIYFGVLTGFAHALAAASTRYLVLSGIREHEADAVSQLYANLGFDEMVRDGDGEWCGMILNREE